MFYTYGRTRRSSLFPPKRRKVCGTRTGPKNHHRHREEFCDDCHKALKKWTINGRPRKNATWKKGSGTCGTNAGRMRHISKGEPVCLPRAAAASAYKTQRRMEKERRIRANNGGDLRPPKHRAICGTARGYTQHRRHFENSCQPCKTAWAAYNRANAQRRKNKKKDTP